MPRPMRFTCTVPAPKIPPGPTAIGTSRVIFSNYETDPLQRAVRPQLLEAEVQRELKRYNQLSIVDQETAPTLLQVDILRSAIKWHDRTVPHVRRIEQSIWSKWEKDYERYCL